MAPKRKAAAPAKEKEDKKPKSGLAVGDDFPELGPLENEETNTVDLKVRRERCDDSDEPLSSIVRIEPRG